MKTTRPVQVLYILFGILYLAMGIGAMLAPPGWLPQKLIGALPAGEMQDPFVAHLVQEFGSVVLAVGLVFLWRARQSEWSAAFHWAMTFYLLLNALIHWISPDGSISPWSRGLINSLPPALMLVAAALQLRTTPPPVQARRAQPPTQSAGDTMAIDILAAGAERPRDDRDAL